MNSQILADTHSQEIPGSRTVVAVVLECRGRIALFRRSSDLTHDGSLWHCITGFVEHGSSPSCQALEEIYEEAGLGARDLVALRHGPVLVIDDEIGSPWLIYTFTAVTERRQLKINWEHDSYRWTMPQKYTRFVNRVPWLDQVLAATGLVGGRGDSEG
ncbi:NUDIX domain-containing protein [Arthrobacter sp. CAU 1506]|uniref:NUDIX domain-containing protein n=1 Tax=Arthrobacter sp. CAU 1506 TaxID=2560052 RepID=UPI00145D9559|nr:NUDIX domain-containing protein [Arthrobacter sp. CAU 1506]